MKWTFMLMLAAVGLLAADHSGVRPRGAAKDYLAYDSAEGFTIGASVVPLGKVKRQLSPDLVKAGYTVLEIAVYPDPGKEVDVFAGDFTMRVGSNPNAANAETPIMVVQSIEADQHMDQPRIPDRVQVHGEQTIGVSTGGRDPVTGRRYPGGVYTETEVGVGVGNPRVGGPPTADPRYPSGDPRNSDPNGGGSLCSASSRETCPERSEGRILPAEKGVRGKGRQPLSPPQHTETRARQRCGRFGHWHNRRSAGR